MCFAKGSRRGWSDASLNFLHGNDHPPDGGCGVPRQLYPRVVDFSNGIGHGCRRAIVADQNN